MRMLATAEALMAPGEWVWSESPDLYGRRDLSRAVAESDDGDVLAARERMPLPNHAWVGGRIVGTRCATLRLADHKGGDPSEWPPGLRVRETPGDALRAGGCDAQR